jgi:hypothetical protein
MLEQWGQNWYFAIFFLDRNVNIGQNCLAGSQSTFGKVKREKKKPL